MNPIFPAEVQDRIQRVTAFVAARGMITPHLVPTRSGGLFTRDAKGVIWRLLTWIPGTSYHRVPSPAHAARAARLVARFHGALLAQVEALAPLRPTVHDTPRHMRRLAEAMDACGEHRLSAGIREVGGEILATWSRWEGRCDPGLPLRPAHGDLKISNLRFDEAGQEAACLLDLDTLGRLTLEEELGDALRSWCNVQGEDQRRPGLDPEVFEATVGGYLSDAPFVLAEERRALVPGMIRISIELAARFCADAFHEAYFGWDPAVAPGRGEHNLIRARSQLAFGQVVEERALELERRVPR